MFLKRRSLPPNSLRGVHYPLRGGNHVMHFRQSHWKKLVRGAIKKIVGQIIHFQHGSGPRTFPDFFIRKTPCSTFDSWLESRRFDCRRPANHVGVQYRLGMQNTPSCPVALIPCIAGQIWCLDQYVPSLSSCANSITIKLYYFYFKILGKIHKLYMYIAERDITKYFQWWLAFFKLRWRNTFWRKYSITSSKTIGE